MKVDVYFTFCCRKCFCLEGEVHDEACSPSKKTSVLQQTMMWAHCWEMTQNWIWNFPIFRHWAKRQSWCVQTVAPLICSRIYPVEQEFRQKQFKFKLIIKPRCRREAPKFQIRSNLFVWHFLSFILFVVHNSAGVLYLQSFRLYEWCSSRYE